MVGAMGNEVSLYNLEEFLVHGAMKGNAVGAQRISFGELKEMRSERTRWLEFREQEYQKVESCT